MSNGDDTTAGAVNGAANAAAPAKPKPSWARGDATAGTRWGQPAAAARRPATDRLRKTIEGLPDWEPLPPGEPKVRRPGQDG